MTSTRVVAGTQLENRRLPYRQALAIWRHRLDRNRVESIRRMEQVWQAGAGRRGDPRAQAGGGTRVPSPGSA